MIYAFISFHFSTDAAGHRIVFIQVLSFQHAASCCQDFGPRNTAKRGSMFNVAIGVTLGGVGERRRDSKERAEMNLVDLCCNRENDQMARWLNKECKRRLTARMTSLLVIVHSANPFAWTFRSIGAWGILMNPGVELDIAQSSQLKLQKRADVFQRFGSSSIGKKFT